MKRAIQLLCLLVCFGSSGWAQHLPLQLSEVSVSDGDTAVLFLSVQDFDSIVSMQLSMQWDTEVATFLDWAPLALPTLAIGSNQANAGELRLSWFDNNGTGRSLDDGTNIVRLRFRAMGQPGASTPVNFSDSPLPIQLFKATAVPNEYDELTLMPRHGRISIAGPLGFNVNTVDVACFGEATGQAIVGLEADTSAYTLRWQNPQLGTFEGFSQNNLPAGNYTLTLLDDQMNVLYTYSLTINQPTAPLFIADVQVASTGCEAPSGSILVTVSGGSAPYQYSLNGQNPQNEPLFPALPAGIYGLTVQDDAGCLISDTLELTSPEAPVINLPAQVELCPGQPLVLQVDSEPGQYLWNTGDTTDSLAVSSPGVYRITVTNAAGCSSVAETQVTAPAPLNAVLLTDFPEVCPGDSLLLEVAGGAVYRWLNEPPTLSAWDIPNPQAFPDSSTTYTVVVANTCTSDTLTVDVLVYSITADAGRDTCIAPDSELRLQAIGGLFYTWQNDPALSAIDIPTPVAKPLSSTTFWVSIEDINGCTTLDSVRIEVADNPLDNLTPYNIITPNDDGLNDVLDFGSLSKFGTNSMKVYNRWGGLVYQKLNYGHDDERFNGYYNGKLLPAGNYFYVLEFATGTLKQTLMIVHE